MWGSLCRAWHVLGWDWTTLGSSFFSGIRAWHSWRGKERVLWSLFLETLSYWKLNFIFRATLASHERTHQLGYQYHGLFQSWEDSWEDSMDYFHIINKKQILYFSPYIYIYIYIVGEGNKEFESHIWNTNKDNITS